MGGMLEKISTDVRACQICADELPLGPRPVFQVHSSARILIAGQAPGSKVHESGTPFDDASGDRLRAWMGVSREAFYNPELVAILPMGFCYPGRGRSGDLPPRPECAPAWRQRLLELMPNIQLTLVIGAYAKGWHMPALKGVSLTEGVKQLVSLKQAGGMKQQAGVQVPSVFLLPHPSPRNNIWLKKNAWFEAQVLPILRARVAESLD